MVHGAGVEGCKQNGLNWVLNPWDDNFEEFSIMQMGWTFIEKKCEGDPQLADAMVEAEVWATRLVSDWRVTFMKNVDDLQALRDSEKKEAAEAKKKKEAEHAAPFWVRVWDKTPKTPAAAAALLVVWVKRLAAQVTWAVKLYMQAHMFFRGFLANPTDAFSAAERITMQATLYLIGLLVTIW